MAEHLSTHSAASAATPQESEMTEKERADALAAEVATLKAEIAAEKAATAAATASAEAAVKADRDRRIAIMALPEAKGREALAEVLFADGATAEKAKAYLAVAPGAQAAPAPVVDDPASAYETQRLAAANLNGTKVVPIEAAKAGWSTAVARYNAGFKN